MKKIDLETYKRKDHFNYFKSLYYPYFGVTVNVNVTDLVNICKEKKVSFYLAFMHVIAKALDGVDELRRRIIDDEIVEFEHCPTSHIELLEDETYVYCTLHHNLDTKEYFKIANEKRNACKNGGSIKEDESADSYIFVSCLPWLNYSAFIQPVGKDSNPRVTWGKYEINFEGKKMMPVSILAHHALADGIHLAKFYQNIDKELDKLVNELRNNG